MSVYLFGLWAVVCIHTLVDSHEENLRLSRKIMFQKMLWYTCIWYEKLFPVSSLIQSQ
jgi:hypothetical protein